MTFSCSGEIVFPRRIVVTEHTTIDGTGESVVLRGGVPGVDEILQARSSPPQPAPHLHLHRVTVSHAAVSVVAGQLILTDVTVSNSPTAGVINLSATATIASSTLSNNAEGIRTELGRTEVVNSTLSGNVVWGIHQAGGRLALMNSTLSGNQLHNSSGSLELSNTLFDNGGCFFSGDVLGRTVVDLGHNLESGNTCGFTQLSSKVDTDPMLGLLADHGGPTATHGLLAGSPAIDAGDEVVCNGDDVAGFDQRGVVRPWRGAACDIGAFEFVSLAQMGDHFKCHEANGDEPDVSLPLTDDFGSRFATIEDPELLCNPVGTNGAASSDPTAHLVCYEIDEEDDDSEIEHAHWEVLVENEFGMQMLEVEDPELLCVPSERGGVPSSLVLEHFKCYEAEGEDLDARVDLVDQFGTARNVRVEEPELFCNPADTNGQGIDDPTTHMVCYEIDGAGLEVLVENRFGEQMLEIDEAKLLCVASAALSMREIPQDDVQVDERCGLGFELALLMSAGAWLRRRRRAS